MTAKRARPKAHKRKTDRRSTVRDGRLSLLAASLLVSANICLFGFFEIISSNRSEFEVTFGDMLPGIFVICLVVSAVLIFAGFLIPKRFRQKYVTILLTLGVLMWIEGSFIRWGYGEFTGTSIDWTAFSWQGWVDAAIWLIPLVVAFRFSKIISRHALFIALTLILLQSGVLVARTIAGAGGLGGYRPEKNAKEAPKVVPQAMCQLSSSRNVFHFIFDGFQTDVFMELVEEEELSGSLDGFIVYRNNMSTANQTLLSVPALFSTDIYDGSVSESEYFQRTLKVGFYSTLFKENYAVNLMPRITMDITTTTNYFDPPSPYAAPYRTRMLKALTYLIDVSMFRHFPHFMKRVVYNDQNWRLSSLIGDPPNHASFHHKALLRDYMNRLETAFSRPAYHFMHLMPPHGPFVTLRDGSYAGKALPNTWESYKNEARYILRMFMDFLNKLRELGLYDSSIVLLHGDHGIGLMPGDNTTAMQRQMNSVSALLLLKPPSAHGPLQESWSQTSLVDIPATMMDLLGEQHSYSGESIMKLDASMSRSRPVVFLTDKSAKEPLVSRWVVKGSVEDSTAWHEVETRRLARRIYDYKWGTDIQFGLAHRGIDYLTSGWSTTSTNYSWNDGTFAEIVFGITPPERDVEIRIAMFAYIVPGKVDRQRIRILANGIVFTEMDLIDKQVREMWNTIPREALRGDRLVLNFELPDAAVPHEIGEGRDSRALAVGLVHFKTALVSGSESR